jgi:LmbE family N-acetylglucosaminyl deacetylase
MAIVMLFKPLLRNVRDVAMAVMEAFWALWFRLGGRIMRPVVRGWSSPGGQRVLAIAPHPDDEAIGCGGTLALHKARGDTIWIAYITDGRGSRALGLDAEEMARRRRQEAEASARSLGADCVEWFGLFEGQWAAEQLRTPLRALLGRSTPDIIYAPSWIDFHPEHYRVACALASLLSELPAARARMRVYQIQVPLTPILTNLVADLSDVAAESTAALGAYATQKGSITRIFRLRHYAAAFYGLRRQAEEFWELPAEQYRALHSATAPWSSGIFRGIRFYPWSDPLAYLKGLAERRRIARLVADELVHSTN